MVLPYLARIYTNMQIKVPPIKSITTTARTDGKKSVTFMQACSCGLECPIHRELTRGKEAILFYAFRYALGRRTYAVSEVVAEIKQNWDKLRQNVQIQIQQEILNAQHAKALGDKCDRDSWQEVLDLEPSKRI